MDISMVNGIGKMVTSGVGAILGIANSAASAASAKKARKMIEEKRGILDEQRDANLDIFNRQYYQDIMDRSETNAMVTQAQRQYQQQAAANNATANIMGATVANRAAMQDAANAGVSNTLMGIAQNASILKDGYTNNWQNQQNNYFQGRLGLQDQLAESYMNQSNQQATAANNGFNSAANVWGNK